MKIVDFVVNLFRGLFSPDNAPTGISRALTINPSRPNCPFYGFTTMMGVVMDTKGNGCALVANSHSPCRMEIGGAGPDWINCAFNTPELQQEIRGLGDSPRIFPDECQPPDSANGWKGVPLRAWIAQFEERVLNWVDHVDDRRFRLAVVFRVRLPS